MDAMAPRSVLHAKGPGRGRSRTAPSSAGVQTLLWKGTRCRVKRTPIIRTRVLSNPFVFSSDKSLVAVPQGPQSQSRPYHHHTNLSSPSPLFYSNQPKNCFASPVKPMWVPLTQLSCDKLLNAQDNVAAFLCVICTQLKSAEPCWLLFWGF